MKKTESLFLIIGLVLTVGAVSAFLYNHQIRNTNIVTENQPVTKYGAFLAAQHAIYVNDFHQAAEFTEHLSDVDYPVVTNTRYIANFLSGKIPDDAHQLKDEKSVASQLIYDAYLLKNDKWNDIYKRHKKDVSPMSAPLRIWSAVATGNTDDALKFIEKLPTASSWKSFVRGQIYATTGKPDKAAQEFANVRADFMNISDYLYMMSFYNHYGLTEDADALRQDFTTSPGGMFMLEYDSVPDWSQYDGYKNALAFSLVQSVSHTQIMMYSDLSILLLRFVQASDTEFSHDTNTLNYYIGQFFFINNGSGEPYFSNIDSTSPFAAFATLRQAESTGDVRALERIAQDKPLFVPVINKIVAHHIQQGNQRAALRVVNRTLKNKNLTDTSRAFFLKTRAHIYYMFGDVDASQRDLHEAANILIADPEILSLQAKIWVAQNRNIEDAYDYAMTLVRQNTTDIMGWETLGRVIATRESDADALELIERVGNVATTYSALFELLGDLYSRSGQTNLARDAYIRALGLSDDGLVIAPVVKKKLRSLK